MRTTTVRFIRLKHSARRTGKCPACGKRVTRSRTFEGSVNPYNLREDGQPRTISEVHAQLVVQAEQWVPNFLHEACEGTS